MLTKLTEIIKSAERLFSATDFEIEYKGSASNLVTSCDIAIQDFLFEQLKNAFGDIGFIGEESENNTDAFSKKYTAIIDPIDGTSNFARGLYESGISVAIYKNGKPYLAAVNLPKMNKLYSAESGKGAYLNGKSIHVSRRDFEHSLCFTSFAAYEKQFSEKCFNIAKELLPEIDDLRRVGSAATEICFLAEGIGELYFEARLWQWDFVAAALILTEAGGFCTQITIENLTATSPQPFLAANKKESLEELKRVVDKHFSV